MTTTPTTEQQAVLEATDRVRLVRAAPGSGKTWLVGEVIRREVTAWKRRGGIVALSHTHVARQAIEAATGTISQHPHFVGTLDSFLYQYVVKPYAHVLNPGLRNVRITPDEAWAVFSSIPQVEVAPRIFVHPQLCTFMPPPESANLAMRARLGHGGTRPLVGREAELVLRAKVALWKRLGRVSYSDANFIAHQILAREGSAAETMRELLARRFPFIVVDELQDTNWLVARAMNCLLARGEIRALVVGDPDQAIYGFSGATPEIFDEVKSLPGAKEYPLRKTQRCAPEICRAAEKLLEGSALESDKPSGHAVVVVYRDPPTTAGDLIGLVQQQGLNLADPEIVVRHNNTAENLQTGNAVKAAKFSGNPTLRILFKAVRRLLQNERDYFHVAETALARAMFDEARIDDDSLRVMGIDIDAWRSEIARMLLDLSAIPREETLYEWGLRAKHRVIAAGLKLNGKQPTIKAPAGSMEGGGDKVMECIAGGHMKVRVRTVHQAKGETHEETVYYIPPLEKQKCPSTEWWDGGKPTEEARVAYVAATRPKKTFVLAIHEENWARLQAARPPFAAAIRILGAAPAPKAQKGLADYF